MTRQTVVRSETGEELARGHIYVCPVHPDYRVLLGAGVPVPTHPVCKKKLILEG